MINFKWIFSPTFSLLVSLITLICAIFVDKNYYISNFMEISLITFNLPVLLWSLLCCIFYGIGLYSTNLIYPVITKKVKAKVLLKSENGVWVLVGLLFTCLLLNSFGVFQLIRAFGVAGFLRSLIGVSDVDLRLAVYYLLKSVNTGWAIAFTAPVISLSFVYLRLKKNSIILILYLLVLATHVLLVLATQSKGPLFTIICSLAFCELFLRYPDITFKKRDVIMLSSIVILLLSLFIIIQSRRNPDVATLSGFLREIIAYTLVSYNRLAYLLDGRLEIPNMFSGFWTNRWFWGLPGEEYIDIVLRGLGFTIPNNSFDSWLDTFHAVNNANLNPKYIWVTIYGEAYADYGWFGFLWFIPYGAISQYSYSALTRGRFEFFALYPLLLQWNLGWYSGATVGTRATLFCILIILIFMLNSRVIIFIRR